MEDAPFKNTRSSTSSLGASGSVRKSRGSLESENSEVFENQNLVNKEKHCERPSRHNWTPSGHLLTNSVADIRNFFHQFAEGHTPFSSSKAIVNSSQTATLQLGQPQVSQAETEQVNNSSALTQVARKQQLPTGVSCPNSVDGVKNAKGVKGVKDGTKGKGNNNRRKRKQGLQRQLVFDKSHDSTISSDGESGKTNCPKMNSNIVISDKITNQVDEIINTLEPTMPLDQDQRSMEEKEENKRQENPRRKDSDPLHGEPKAMDLQMVLHMFKEIKNDLGKIKKEEIEVQKIGGIKLQQNMNTQSIKAMEQDICKENKKLGVVTGALQNMASTINQMNKRITELEKHNIRNCLVLTGFYASGDKDDCIEQLSAFFQEQMDLEVDIEDVYFMGLKEP